jgi:hypothetical protein
MTPTPLTTYLGLVTAEHAPQPNFNALLTALLQPLVDEQVTLAVMPQVFDLDVAVGDQLDAIGEWVGLSRNPKIPLSGVYFSFDTINVGFDQGIWYSSGDPTTATINLTDNDYRALLRVKIRINHWDGTVGEANSILQQLFTSIPSYQSPGSTIFIIDRQDMSFIIAVTGAAPNNVIMAFLSGGYISFRPAGVLMDVVVTSVPGAPLFGFDMENAYVSGFDVGAWGTVLAEV